MSSEFGLFYLIKQITSLLRPKALHAHAGLNPISGVSTAPLSDDVLSLLVERFYMEVMI